MQNSSTNHQMEWKLSLKGEFSNGNRKKLVQRVNSKEMGQQLKKLDSQDEFYPLGTENKRKPDE